MTLRRFSRNLKGDIIVMEHRLFNEAQALPGVSPAAALAYRDNMEKLRLQVDKEMAAFPDILPLIGFSPWK